MRRHVLYAEQAHETSVGDASSKSNVLALWLARRQRFLRGDDAPLARVLTLFWTLAKPTQSTSVRECDYVAFFQCVAKALVQSVGNDHAARVAARDWAYDSQGNETLSLPLFYDAVLQCTELVLPVESDVPELLAFLHELRDAIAVVRDETYRLRSLKDVVKVRGTFLQSMPPSVERLGQIRGLASPDMDSMSLKQLLLGYNPRKFSLSRKFSSLFSAAEAPIVDPEIPSPTVSSRFDVTPLLPSRLVSQETLDAFNDEDALVTSLETCPALRIAVVGLPGAGKSRVAASLATRLGLQYVSAAIAIQDALVKKKQRDDARQERQRQHEEAHAAAAATETDTDGDAAVTEPLTVEAPTEETEFVAGDAELEALLHGEALSHDQILVFFTAFARATLLRGVGVVLDDVFPFEVENELAIDYVVSLEMTRDDALQHVTGLTVAPTSRRVYDARERAMLTECDAVLRERGLMDSDGFSHNDSAQSDDEHVLEERRARVADAVAAVHKPTVVERPSEANEPVGDEPPADAEPTEAQATTDSAQPPSEAAVSSPAERNGIEPLDEPTVSLRALRLVSFDAEFLSFQSRAESLTKVHATQLVEVVAAQSVADIVAQCVVVITNNTHGLSRASVSRAVRPVALPEDFATTGTRADQLRWLLYGDWTEMLSGESSPFAFGPCDPLAPRALSRWRDCCLVSSASPSFVVGSPAFAAYYSGRIYLLASAAARDAFVATPLQYLRRKPPLLPPLRKLWVVAPGGAIDDSTANALAALVYGKHMSTTQAIATQPPHNLVEGKTLTPVEAAMIIADALGDAPAWVLTDLVYTKETLDTLAQQHPHCRPDAIVVLTPDESRRPTTPLDIHKHTLWTAGFGASSDVWADAQQLAVPVIFSPLFAAAHDTQAAVARLLSPLTPRVDRDDDGTRRDPADTADERVFLTADDPSADGYDSAVEQPPKSRDAVGYDATQRAWITKRRRMGATAQFCPVSWATKRVLVPGQSTSVASYQQKLYACAGPEELAAFERNPSRYIPAAANATQSVVPVIWILGVRGAEAAALANAVGGRRVGVVDDAAIAERVQRRLRAQLLLPMDQQTPLEQLYIDELATQVHEFTSHPETWDAVVVAKVSTSAIQAPAPLEDAGDVPVDTPPLPPLPTPELLALCFQRDLFPTMLLSLLATEDFVVQRQLSAWRDALPTPRKTSPSNGDQQEEEAAAVDPAELEAAETTRLQEQFQADLAALTLALETLQSRGITVEPPVDIAVSSRAIIKQLADAIATLVRRKASIFEYCTRVSVADAVAMLRAGEAVVGKHAMRCPVTGADPLADTVPALVYRGRLYFPASAVALAQCEAAPAATLVDPPSQPPQVRVSCAVVGPPGVGRTRLARRLAARFGLTYVSPQSAIEWARQCLGPQTSLWNLVQDVSNWKQLDPALAHDAIYTRLCSADCQRRGWVLDDYLETADALARCLDAAAQPIYPGVVFAVEGTGHEKPIEWQTHRLDLIRLWTATFGAFHHRQLDTDVSSAWQVHAQASAVLTEHARVTRQYAQGLAMGRPVRLYGVVRTQAALEAAADPTYQTFCPVELTAGRYYASELEDRERCVEAEGPSAGQRVVVWLASEPNVHDFCARVPSFWSDDALNSAKDRIPKAPIDASLLSLLTVADCEFPEMKGYCPVTFQRGTGDIDWEAIVRGSVFYRVSYDDKVFFCVSEAARRAFVSEPTKYASQNLPIKLPPSLTMPLAFKNCPGRIEQELSGVLNETLLLLGAARPKFIGISSEATACMYMGLLLKTRATKTLPERLRLRYVERLRAFERDCRVAEELKRHVVHSATTSCGPGIKGARAVQRGLSTSALGDSEESVDDAETLRQRFDELTSHGTRTTYQSTPRPNEHFLELSPATANGGYHGAHNAKHETTAAFELFRFTGILFLVGLSAIFSGLTLGLMALDKTALDVTIGAGEAPGATAEEARNAQCAKRILPIRENGNQLLTTLVLGTVAVNSLLSILMADLTSGLAGFLLSTVVIVIAGEIVPQAIFSRHALRVGAALVPLVQLFLVSFYVFAKPISMCLDYSLGADVGTIFSKRELQKLLEIHVKQQMLHPNEGHIVRGAMSYRQKQVASVMVPVGDIFSLSISFTILDVETIKSVYQSGFSRIPVWGKDQNDVIGVFLVKDLAMIDSKEGDVTLREFIEVFSTAAHRVWADSTLGDVLKTFKAGNTHLALVYDVNNQGPGDPFYELKGLVTLEDIVEEILQDKIAGDTHSPEARHARKQCADRVTMDYV